MFTFVFVHFCAIGSGTMSGFVGRSLFYLLLHFRYRMRWVRSLHHFACELVSTFATTKSYSHPNVSLVRFPIVSLPFCTKLPRLLNPATHMWFHFAYILLMFAEHCSQSFYRLSFKQALFFFSSLIQKKKITKQEGKGK